MRWRALLVIVTSVIALSGVLLVIPSPVPAPSVEHVVVARAQEGDVVTARVLAYDGSKLVYDSVNALTYTAGVPGDSILPGVGDALVNATPGETLNLTLPPAEAFGNWSWDNVVNVTRVNEVPRSVRVSERALDQFLGHRAKVGEDVKLPQWPARVTSLVGGVATVYATPQVGDSVQRLAFWPSVVTAITNDTMTLRDDATVGTPVDTQGDDEGSQPLHGNVSFVNDTIVQVDLNAPHSGRTVLVEATVLSIKAGSGTLGLIAKLEAGQASCESHHAGFVSFKATSDVAPNANGTAWVNVTVGDPWQHDLQDGMVHVGNDSQPIPVLSPGQTTTLSFLEPANAKLPVSVSGDAHFRHGGGIPDDSLYAAQATANTAVRHQSASVDVSSASLHVGAASVTWGRVLGWLSIPLMLYPAWEGYRVRQARLQGRVRSYSWPKWLDMHTMPAVAATLVGFGHGAVLMLDVYKGDSSLGVWTGIIALGILGGLGASGLVMARWVPARWREARRWHAGLTVLVLVLGLVHALLIGSTFKFLRW